MAILIRFLILALGVATLALLWNLPDFLDWDVGAAIDWLAALQLAGPGAAMVLSAWAAYHSLGRDRIAWRMISCGSIIYIVANIAYIALSLEGNPFPTLVDVAFFIMALIFAAGIVLYGRGNSSSPTIDTFNFILLYGSTIVGTLFLLHHHIKASSLSEFATLVAFLYPALWSSVAVLSAAILVLYPHGRRRVPLALLTTAVALEALADFIYATQLMNGTYQIAGWPHLLWMGSASFVTWAAAEHLWIAREINADLKPDGQRDPRLWGEAGAPAAILFVVLITGSIAGAFGRGLYQYFSSFLAIALTVTVGLREYWIVATRNHLKHIANERLQKLSNSEALLSSVLQSTSDSVVVLDRNWRVQFWNKQATALIPELGNNASDYDFWNVFGSAGREVYGSQLEDVFTTGVPLEIETRDAATDRWINLRVYSTGNGVALFFRDVTERRRFQDEIEHLAHHDFLTGLSNRAIFYRKLAEVAAEGRPVAVFMIDIDTFKEINDAYGHTLGDRVLVEFSRRLESSLPHALVLARLGGDEFAAIMEIPTATDAVALADRISSAMEPPFMEGDEPLFVRASVGIAHAGRVSAEGELFMQADIALYEAKAHGNAVLLYEPAMELRIKDRKEMLDDLSRAIENDELELVYQPLLDTSSCRTAGFEALLRWRNPRRGLVGPDAFIPLAEESGLIVDIGEWVLRTACIEATKWPANLSVAVNLSARQFSDDQLIDKIVTALMDSGLDHRRLELEVTETALLEESNLPILKEICGLGIRLALDDFGTGYASLSYLQRIPFSKLKIDRTFVHDLSTNARSRAIVGTIVELARILGMKVTAEGVETAEQLDWIAQRCDAAQGYYISKPLSAKDTMIYIKNEYHSDDLNDRYNVPDTEGLRSRK